MGLFGKKKAKGNNVEDYYAPAYSKYPKHVIQFGEYTTTNVQFWIVYRNYERMTILVSGPLGFNDALEIASSRGLPYLFVRTSQADNYTLETVMQAFKYRYGGLQSQDRAATFEEPK